HRGAGRRAAQECIRLIPTFDRIQGVVNGDLRDGQCPGCGNTLTGHHRRLSTERVPGAHLIIGDSLSTSGDEKRNDSDQKSSSYHRDLRQTVKMILKARVLFVRRLVPAIESVPADGGTPVEVYRAPKDQVIVDAIELLDRSILFTMMPPG